MIRINTGKIYQMQWKNNRILFYLSIWLLFFFYSRSFQRSRHETTNRTSRSSHHSHSRDLANEISSNDNNFDVKSKKRTHHHYHTDNSNHSPKRNRRTSPLPSYSTSIYSSHYNHHQRKSKYHRKSSSSSTRSSERSSSNENDDNAKCQRSTKGTLASELDKLRPKFNKNKTVTTNTQSQNEQKPDSDVRIKRKRIHFFQYRNMRIQKYDEFKDILIRKILYINS